jgi:hypothetical protein
VTGAVPVGPATRRQEQALSESDFVTIRIRTVRDLMVALSTYPHDYPVELIQNQEDGDKVASTIEKVYEVDGVICLEDETY